jgi:hypothetical protein
MIIAAGTSRLVVFSGHHLPTVGAERNSLLRNLMLGGLGGDGSQSNKVVVVERNQHARLVTFHFYQVLLRSGELFDHMECSNASAAAGLFALLNGLVHLEKQCRWLRAQNAATGQKITLRVPAKPEDPGSPWGVRFRLPARINESFQAFRDQHQMTLNCGLEVNYHLVQHGNLFVFCNLCPSAVTTEVSLEIARLASEKAVCIQRAKPPFLPKVIPYQQVDGANVRASSFFEGERHASMPGSAAMALCLFLRLCLNAAAHQYQVHFCPNREAMTVRLGFENDLPRFSQFFTPARLLLDGNAHIFPT